MQFNITISHVPGKDLITADTLSRAPTPLDRTDDQTLLTEVAAFVATATATLPATDHCLKEITKVYFSVDNVLLFQLICGFKYWSSCTQGTKASCSAVSRPNSLCGGVD